MVYLHKYKQSQFTPHSLHTLLFTSPFTLKSESGFGENSELSFDHPKSYRFVGSDKVQGSTVMMERSSEGDQLLG